MTCPMGNYILRIKQPEGWQKPNIAFEMSHFSAARQFLMSYHLPDVPNPQKMSHFSQASQRAMSHFRVPTQFLSAPQREIPCRTFDTISLSFILRHERCTCLRFVLMLDRS